MTASPPIARHRVTVDVSSVAPAGVRHVVAEIVVGPAPDAAARVALVCLPGGGMSRRYFDLQAEGAGDEYSMAAYLARRGVVVITLDHPGVGESDAPEDGYTLDPRTVANVDAYAARAIIDGLGRGALVEDLAAMAALVPVGCGHSMGGLVTAYIQAHHGTYRAIAPIGFAGGGLLTHLTDVERTYVDAPARVAADIRVLVEQRFGAPRSGGTGTGTGTSPFLLAVAVADNAKAAIGASGSFLLNLCGLTSMIPGASRPELEAVDVPVFLGVGEFDITGDPHHIPVQFPASRDITLFVCPGAGHNANVAPTRELLWERLFVWLRQIADADAPRELHAGHP